MCVGRDTTTHKMEWTKIKYLICIYSKLRFLRNKLRVAHWSVNGPRVRLVVGKESTNMRISHCPWNKDFLFRICVGKDLTLIFVCLSMHIVDKK